VLNFDDPGAPDLLDEFTAQARAVLYGNQDRAYVIEGDHIVVRDVATHFTFDRIPLHTPLGRALARETGLTPSAPAQDGGPASAREILYVSAGFGSVLVMDVTDPLDAFHVGEFTAPGLLPTFMVSNGNDLFVGDDSGAGRLLVIAAQDVTGPTTGVAPRDADAPTVRLAPSRPNPFTASTRIAFALARPGRVDLALFDAAGRQVRSLASGPFGAGEHTVIWDGSSDAGGRASTGIYFARLVVDGETRTRKVVRMK
jgi:hypothetical protein